MGSADLKRISARFEVTHEKSLLWNLKMSIESLFATVHQPYLPPMLFCAGLFTSVVCCLVALLIESRFRRQAFRRIVHSRRELAYGRFLSELNSSPRHLGFASGDIYDLDDLDFPSKSK